MPLNTNIKFFTRPIVKAIDASSTVNQGTIGLITVPDDVAKWVGGLADTISLKFVEQDITRIILTNHNLKNYTIKFRPDGGGAFLDFTNVLSLDGIKANISETGYSRNTSYYEFDKVTASEVQLIFTTNVVNAQIEFFGVMQELGTFNCPVVPSKHLFFRKIGLKRGADNRTLPTYQLRALEATIQAKENFDQADVDLIDNLTGIINTFLVWFSGGNQLGFSVIARPWRLQDIYLVNATSDFNAPFQKGFYGRGYKTKVTFKQATL